LVAYLLRRFWTRLKILLALALLCVPTLFAAFLHKMPAEDMEKLVTRKLETQLKGLADMKEMTSTSSEGVSTVVLEFTSEVDMSDALQSVRDAIELAKPELPDDVKEDLIVKELSASDWPIMQVVLSGDYDPTLLKKVGEDLQEALEQVQGVLGVDLTGGVEQEVRVERLCGCLAAFPGNCGD